MKAAFYENLTQLVGNPTRCRFLLAVSGGRDSVLLTHLFHACQLSFAIAHCNFHLRGEDANKDHRFVQQLAANYGVAFLVKEFDTLAIQRGSGKSVEMVARELRYGWFDEIGQPFDFVVTAHHANDNAETLLLNLLRGTGLQGLTGIPAKNGRYLRPLLPFSAQQIAAEVARQHLAFRIDQSNFSDAYQRNKIRHYVLPKLADINPEVIATFSQNMTHFRQQLAFYQRQMALFEQELLTVDDEKWQISIEKLRKNPDKELVLYEILKKFQFSAAVATVVARHLDAEPGKWFFSPEYCLVKDRNFLIIKKIDNEPTPDIRIDTWEELSAHGFSVTMQPVSQLIDFERNNKTIYVDADKLTFPLTLRQWRAGDYFHPFGMRGTKKISDFLKDEKISRLDKPKVQLLCCNQTVVWVVGLRADNRFRLGGKSKNFLKITQNGRENSPL